MSSLILKMLFEGLMRENREGRVEYGVAESVDISPDCKTYLFNLRKTRWSNGSMVTAFDFEYAWKKVLSPNFKTPFAYLFYPIKNAELAKNGTLPSDAIGIHALDEMSLKVELQFPSSSFLELTTHTIYSPVHRLIDQLHPNWPFEEGKAYICNGGFLLNKNNVSQGYELTKNPLYWDAENIQLEGISVLKMNRHQALEKFQTEHNHWVGDPLSMWDSHFKCGEDDESVDSLSKSMYWYAFNCQKPPFNNKKMRQAFSLAIDRKAIANVLRTQYASTPLPLGHSLIEESHLSHFNPQFAQDLFNEALEEIALPKNNFPSLTLIHSTGTIKNKLAQSIKHFWENTFGIQCVVEALEWSTLFARITEGRYQVGCIAWLPWVNDPMYTLNAFRDAKEPLNFPKWNHPQYQKILHQVEQEKDFQKRRSYYLQAEQLLLEEMPVAPICFHPAQALKKKNLKIHPSSLFLNFKWAHFEHG
jgi:oligopeptide transport system substrate-binding protein